MKTEQKIDESSLKKENKIFDYDFITKAQRLFSNPEDAVDKLFFGIDSAGKKYISALYLYHNSTSRNETSEAQVASNLNEIKEISKNLALSFVPKHESGSVCFANNNEELRDEFKQVFAPLDLLAYIYAVMHSAMFSGKSNPLNVPYPEDSSKFWKLVKLGGEMRSLYLFENPIDEKEILEEINKLVLPSK